MKPHPIFWVLLMFLAIFSAGEAFAGQGYRIVNTVDDFLAYHREAKDKNGQDRIALWDARLEARHPVFFADAIYRRKTGEDRERYKLDCIRRFWTEVAPRMNEIARLNQGAEAGIESTVREFRKHLPGFQPDTDFYVTISFSFRGKAVTVGGKDVLAIGLEAFLDSNDQQLPITMAHELFHLYHFRFFSAGGGLYRSLWTEGLASFASAVVVPGQRRSVYLGFPAEKMNRCQELLPMLAADLRKNLGDNDHRLQRIYFGAEPNDTQVPPEAGYFVGLLIVENLAENMPLDRLARMSADQVFKLLQGELDRLANRK